MFESLSSNEQEVVLSYTLDNKRGVFRLCTVPKIISTLAQRYIHIEPLEVGASSTKYFFVLVYICCAHMTSTKTTHILLHLLYLRRFRVFLGTV